MLLSWLLIGRLGPLTVTYIRSGWGHIQSEPKLGLELGLAGVGGGEPLPVLPSVHKQVDPQHAPCCAKLGMLVGLGLVSLALWLLVAHLALLHCYLMATGQTTLELLRVRGSRRAVNGLRKETRRAPCRAERVPGRVREVE